MFQFQSSQRINWRASCICHRTSSLKASLFLTYLWEEMHCHVFPPVFSKWVASQYIKCLLSKQQSMISSVQNKISSLAKIRVPVFSFHLHSCRWHLDILMLLCGYKFWENWDHLGNYWSHGYCHCSEHWSSSSVSLESSSASMHLEHNDLAHLENKISGTLILVQIQIFCLHFFLIM